MIPRWTLRLGMCLFLLGISACAGATAPQATARPNEVEILEPVGRPSDWSYSPRELAVMRGATVTFVNRGNEFHTITSDDPGRSFDLSVSAGQIGTIDFDKVGTFAYHCGVHPQMKGIVRVCDGPCG